MLERSFIDLFIDPSSKVADSSGPVTVKSSLRDEHANAPEGGRASVKVEMLFEVLGQMNIRG